MTDAPNHDPAPGPRVRGPSAGSALAGAVAIGLTGVALARWQRRRATSPNRPPTADPTPSPSAPSEPALPAASETAEAPMVPSPQPATSPESHVPQPRRASRSLGRPLIGAVLALVGVVLVAVAVTGSGPAASRQEPPGPVPRVADAAAIEAALAPPPFTPPNRSDEVRPAAPSGPSLAPPVRIRIPARGIDAPIDPLGLTDDGALDVPEDHARAGWWTGGTQPGALGRAVIVGHVDSFAGPGAFFGLSGIIDGTEIHVQLADASTVVYRVHTVEQHAKDAFPTDIVYGDDDDPLLRLITCGGAFDDTVRSYDDNVIVFAHLVETLPAPLPI